MKHSDGRPEMALSREAEGLFTDWYLKKEVSVHARRLDTIALRLMALLTVNDLKGRVDEDTMRRVIELADWQLNVRKQHDPIDADNKIARMEQKIRRLLGTGPKTERELRQKANADRAGIWQFEIAFKNLQRARDIAHDESKK